MHPPQLRSLTPKNTRTNTWAPIDNQKWSCSRFYVWLVSSRPYVCHNSDVWHNSSECMQGSQLVWHYLFSHCNALQHTATHCNTLQHTATHCNCNTLQLQHFAAQCNSLQLQHTATRCDTLRHTATHCNCKTLQNTATHCNCNTLQHITRRGT